MVPSIEVHDLTVDGQRSSRTALFKSSAQGKRVEALRLADIFRGNVVEQHPDTRSYSRSPATSEKSQPSRSLMRPLRPDRDRRAPDPSRPCRWGLTADT